MKRILSLLILTVLVVASCSKYDDTELRNKVNGYESRIAALEALSSYKDLLGKLSAGKTVTGFSQSGNEITLTFSDNTTVKFNQQGPKGDPGESIKGDPGDPGDPGSPGQDGVTPQFKIEGESWMVSYDEGKTWKNVGSAIDRSLIEDIKVVGDVLQITLAGGTVVNVPFGEKDGYGFSVDRNVLFGFENQMAFREGEFLVPYTLTGDIKNIDDVQFSVTVTNYGSDYFAPYKLKLDVEPADAKSGVFRVTRKGYITPPNTTFEDGEWWLDYPAADFDVTAFFPDGTSRMQKIKVLGYDIYASPTNGDYVEWSDTYNTPWIPLPSAMGDYAFTITITMDDYYKYDLAEPAQLAFDDIFRAEQAMPIFTVDAHPTKTGPTMIQSDEDLIIQYVVTYHYTGFTGTGTRKSSARIWKWVAHNSMSSLMYVTFSQTN